MKIQISQFSPHQNAKVFGVLMAVSSLIFVIPMAIMFSFFPFPPGKSGPPVFMFLLFPVMYLIVGYISVAIGCLLYNFICKYIGGIEYETNGEGANPAP